MLFIYAFFLEHVARSVTILFVAAPRAATLTNIRSDLIVGAVSARSLIQVFQRQLPEFAGIASPLTDYRGPLDDFLRYGRIPDIDFFEMIRDRIWHPNRLDGQYLSKDETLLWLGPKLSTRKIDIEIDPSGLREIRRALELGEEFVISVERGRFRSVIDLSEFARGVTRTVLAEVQRKRM